MSGPAKVIVVDADPAATAALRFGLARAGISARSVSAPSELVEAARSASLVVLGQGASAVRATRERLEAAALPLPILYVGQGAERRELERAGATEVLLGAVFLRDVASVARVMLGERRPEGWGGTLVEQVGVLGLARGLAALGRSGVLTLTRGIRRGEIRYYHGEITSAQVGIIHGQAAFHQLLLWTEARFDFRHELVVRRQQIPLPPEEVMADAERFLESIRDIAGGLAPSIVLDVMPAQMAALAPEIPTEVHGILNMFDGQRALVDVLEDSPYRVYETLRIVRKGFESQVLRIVPQARNRKSWRPPLPIEDWLLGNDAPTPGLLAKEAAHPWRHRRDSGPLEWAELVPRVSNLDMPTLSPIVPATKVAGEIEVASAAHVEKLATGRTVIVSEDAVITPEDRAEEERLIRERAEREEREERERERAAAEQAAAEQAATERAAAERAAAEQAAAEKAVAERAAAERAVAERAAAEKAVAEQAAAERAVAERAAAEKAVAEQAAAERAVAERAAAERAAAEAAAKSAAVDQAATDRVAAEKPAEASTPLVQQAAAAAAVAEAIAAAETIPVARPGAPRRQTTSDILPKHKKRKRTKTARPVETTPEEPALVADLQVAHAAVSSLADAQAAAAASPDTSTVAPELASAIAQVTADAQKASAAFTAEEEAFFQAGQHHHAVETFADLEQGHRRPTFWQRLVGKHRSSD